MGVLSSGNRFKVLACHVCRETQQAAGRQHPGSGKKEGGKGQSSISE